MIEDSVPVDVALLLGNAGERIHLHVITRQGAAVPWSTDVTVRGQVVLDAEADTTGRGVLDLATLSLLPPGVGDIGTEEVPTAPVGTEESSGRARVVVRGDGPSDTAHLVLPADLLVATDAIASVPRARILIDTHLMGRTDFDVDLVVSPDDGTVWPDPRGPVVAIRPGGGRAASVRGWTSRSWAWVVGRVVGVGGSGRRDRWGSG